MSKFHGNNGGAVPYRAEFRLSNGQFFISSPDPDSVVPDMRRPFTPILSSPTTNIINVEKKKIKCRRKVKLSGGNLGGARGKRAETNGIERPKAVNKETRINELLHKYQNGGHISDHEKRIAGIATKKKVNKRYRPEKKEKKNPTFQEVFGAEIGVAADSVIIYNLPSSPLIEAIDPDTGKPRVIFTDKSTLPPLPSSLMQSNSKSACKYVAAVMLGQI